MNDLTNTKIFETVLQILDRHGLIKRNMDIEEEKNKACIDCLPIIEQLKQDDADLYKYLQELMMVLNIDFDAKHNLENMFKTIISEIVKLKCNNSSIEVKLGAQEQRLIVLEDSMKLQQANMIAYDLLRLFLFYFVEPAIDRSYRTWKWNKFTNKWSELEVDVMTAMHMNFDDIVDPTENALIQNHKLIRDFVGPVECNLKEQFGHEIELKIIKKMVNQRHKVVHEDAKSVPEQRSFLLKCKTFEYPKEYIYADHLKSFMNMIAKLDDDKNKTKLRRVC